ncbi:transcriptional regulator MntR [Nitrososphaera sp.]|uniref:transcriptional regulator MntR n=1 Tax=Nitrososphaera sp. TaxID=1971748 RepID=UPI00307EDCCE
MPPQQRPCGGVAATAPRKSGKSSGKPSASGRLDSIRDAHNVEKASRTTRMEDYLEVIYELIQHKGYATTVDISDYLNVSSPSVTKMLQRLNESGHVNYEKYRGIALTDSGVAIAKSMHDRHGVLAEFLMMIGVDKDIANRDAEGIEHHLHPETLKKLEEFVRLAREKNKNKESP